MSEEQTDSKKSEWSYPATIDNVLRGKYSVQIILIIGDQGPIRWGNIEDQLDGGHPNAISDRLEELCTAGMAERKSYDQVPPHVEYSLTSHGEELYAELAMLMELDPDFTDAFVGKWAIPIICGLGEHGPLRNKDIFRALDTSSSSTLADHLDKLREEGLVSRTSYDEVPPRVEYSLTARGERLYPTFQKLSIL